VHLFNTAGMVKKIQSTQMQIAEQLIADKKKSLFTTFSI